MVVDPRNADQVALATRAWVRSNVEGATDAAWLGPLVAATGGMSTFIWFGQLQGSALPHELRAPLAIRVFGDPHEDVALERETGVLGFVAACDFPAPLPLASARASDGDANPVGLPWMVLPHVPGDPLLTVISKAPWGALARLRELAAIQAALHAIPVAGCPLPSTGALVDRWFAHRGPEIEGPDDPRANALLAALRERADVVRHEHPVVCHGDFHPLNVLSRKVGSRWEHVIIDWTDAVVGDRHFDVSRTLALFSVASIAAESRAERMGLRVAAPLLVRTYRRAYESFSPLEPDRLAYWSAAHLLRGWAQITVLHQGGYGMSRADTDAIPLSVADALIARAEQELASVD